MNFPSEPSSDEFSIRSISSVMNIIQPPPNSDFEFESSPLRETYNYMETLHFNHIGQNNFLTDFSNMTFSENENDSDNSSSMLKFKIPKINTTPRQYNSTEEQSEEANEDRYGMQNSQFKFRTNPQDLGNNQIDEMISNNDNREICIKMKDYEKDYQMGTSQGIQKNSQWVTTQKYRPRTKVHLFKSNLKREKDSIPAFSPNLFQSPPLSKFFSNVEIKNRHHLKQEILIQPSEEQFEGVKQFENDFNEMINSKRSVLHTDYQISNNSVSKNNQDGISNTNISPYKFHFLTPRSTPISQLPPKVTTIPLPPPTTTHIRTTIRKTKRNTNKNKNKKKKKIKSTRSKLKAKSPGSKLKSNTVNNSIVVESSPLSIDSTNLIQDGNENSNASLRLQNRKRLRRSSRVTTSNYKHLTKSYIPTKSKLPQTQIQTETQTQMDLQQQSQPQTKTHNNLKTRNFNKENKANFNKQIQKSNSRYPTQINNNKEMIKLGKSVYKVLIGALWVVFGGSSQTQISPYSEKIGNHISRLLGVSARNIHSTPLGLKNLLSNSRRTFAEFILEILIGVLSLCYLKEPPNLSTQLKDLLIKVVNFQKNFPNNEMLIKNLSKNLKFKNDHSNNNNKCNNNNNNNNNNKNKNKNNDNNNNSNNIINNNNNKNNFYNGNNLNDNIINNNKYQNQNEKKIENENLLINELNNLYSQIFVEDVVMFWFEKRFVPNSGLRLHSKERTKFFSEYISVIGNYCFIRCCNLLALELTKQSNGSVTDEYFRLINSPYDNNPLNCYFNNRMGKVKLITNLIVKFSINKGAYWDGIVNFFGKKIVFNLDNFFDVFPFNIIINLPLIKNNIKIKFNNENLNSTFTRKTLNPSLN
ncbi:hypothetical protein M0812_09575 [Anaeramoeba flamelloides]|uniref:Uncharacterized protein n=1 Tax=Anaeramoeba flamelloides TaxID=1746091 RepID=A0AAV7ZNZ9_9EUKA|nr:hypothetical protein M0812_09575 [Anaeramoeba flamelloides]